MKVNFDDLKNIYEKEVRKNTKNKRKVYCFERFKMTNLTNLYDSLVLNQYRFMRYNIFLVRSPKYRVVMSLNIGDKIINHYITRFILIPKLEKYLDMRNVATRKDMGRDYGIMLVKKYLEHFKRKENCYVLKMDISKYFYSIDHNKLKELLKKDLDEEEYELLCTVIDSTNYDYINETIKKLKETELKRTKVRREEIEKLPYYLKGKGLPIGNMSSQFLSIFYLSRLDHKIIHDYHLKYFVRYMDDILIFSEDKEYLKIIKEKIEKELEEDYLLTVNKKKTNIVNVKHGFSFCGYSFRICNHKTVMTVCGSTKRRVKQRVKEVKYLYKRNRLSFESAFSSMNTYYNGFKYGSKMKMRRIVEKYFFG